MVSIPRSLSGLALAAAVGFLVSACSGGGFSGVKEAFVGKAMPEPDLPQHPPLVMPSPNSSLPVPGQAQAQAQQSVPNQATR
jgi:hypothetical protein